MPHRRKQKNMITRSAGKKIFKNKITTKSSLASAIKFGKLKVVKFLIKEGANINKPGLSGRTPLHIAAKYGHLKIIKLLIQNGANVNAVVDGPNQHRLTPFHLAVQYNHSYCALLLFEFSIPPKTEDVSDLIYFTVFNNNIALTELLLCIGVDVNLRLNNNFFEEFGDKLHRSLWRNKNLPLLHYVILRKFIELALLLLEYGADPNLKTSKNKTALMQAVDVSNFTSAHLLVNEYHANVNDRDIYGKPVLHFIVLNANTKKSMYSKEEYALQDEKYDILKLLVTNGADVNVNYPKNTVRSTVIHYMIWYGFAPGVHYLLYYSDINFKTIDLLSVYSAEFSEEEVTPDIENDEDHLHNIRLELEYIVEEILQKLIDFYLIGLPFSKDLISLFEKPIHKWISVDKFMETMDLYHNNLVEKINHIKQKNIGDSNITIWRLLTCEKNELIKLTSNKNVRNFDVYEDFHGEDTYQFSYILNKRLLNAKNENILLEKSTEFIFSLFINHLPYHCCEKIISYFNSQELDQSFRNLEFTEEVLNEQI